jgi:adenosylhomocysteine nucleosidase
MSKIAIIVAMNKELDLFADLSEFKRQKYENYDMICGTVYGHEIAVTVSGIGKVNAALCTAAVIRFFAPDLVLNIGISGGLDGSVAIGDFIIGAQIAYHDVWCGEPNAYGQIQGCPAVYRSTEKLCAVFKEYTQGLICCGDKFITDTAELQEIKNKFPAALAVDMESAAIAQTCLLYQTPLLCFRQISDTPGEHQAEQYANFWQNAPQNSFDLIRKILRKL